jgi:TM2 domain-containing membrane protein YozV
VDYSQFERSFLRLAFSTSIDLSPASTAFLIGVPVKEAERHMQTLVDQGVLELDSDDDGRIKYRMPDRPSRPLDLGEVGSAACGLGSEAPMRALVPMVEVLPQHAEVSPGTAALGLFLNAMVCPGVGSLIGGRTGAGVAQLSLFLIGLPLAVLHVGLPLIMVAWVWGIATGAAMISESHD